MRKREPEAYSKKKYIQTAIIGLGCFALAIISLAVGTSLQDRGLPQAIYLPFCIACFPLLIADIAYLIYHWPGMQLYEMEKQWKQVQEAGCRVIENPQWQVEDFCKTEKFKYLNQGYYHRRKFNFQRDYVNYYIRICTLEDVRMSLEQQLNRFDGYEFKGKNKCLLFFAEKNGVTDEDRQALLDFANIFLRVESAAPGMMDTALVILRDTQTGKAWCVPPGKNKLTLYNVGYKLAMKILNG